MNAAPVNWVWSPDEFINYSIPYYTIDVKMYDTSSEHLSLKKTKTNRYLLVGPCCCVVLFLKAVKELSVAKNANNSHANYMTHIIFFGYNEVE